MLTEKKRADLLARSGPVLAMLLAEHTARRWTYVPQDVSDFGVLRCPDDGMQLGLLPGWFEAAERFELAPFIRSRKGVAHTVRSLGLVGPSASDLRIQVTNSRGMERVAADVVRRLVEPYAALHPKVRALLAEDRAAADAQERVAASLATLTGAIQERHGDDISLAPEIGGVRLPLRVSLGGTIELGSTGLTETQLRGLVAGLQRADKLAPSGRRR